jgi:predicted acyltransferase
MTSSPTRIESIDIIRGLTIAFMIIVNTPGSWSYVYTPLLHAEWHGCTPTDLVFPFFTFIVGLSMSQSLRNIDNMDRKDLLFKTSKRAAMIFLVGLFINYYPFFNKEIGNLRIYGVLQRIAVAYFIASFVVIIRPKNFILPLTAVLAVVYFLILTLGQEGPYDLMTNAVRMFDLSTIGASHMYKGFEHLGESVPFDPEGLLGGFGTAINILLGYSLGYKLNQMNELQNKIRYSIILGLVCTAIGWMWDAIGLPINKPLWTSSYAFYTSGLCALLFAFVTYIIDVKGINKWSFPFKVFGMNALASFAMSGLVVKTLNLIKIDGTTPYSGFYKHIMSPIFGPYLGSFLSAICFCSLIWSIAYYLYKKRIFIKV